MSFEVHLSLLLMQTQLLQGLHCHLQQLERQTLKAPDGRQHSGSSIVGKPVLGETQLV